MKVLHILNHFLPDQLAGTEVYVWALAKHLTQYGYQSKVVIPNYGKTVDETYTYDNLVVIRYAEPTVQDRALIMGRKLPKGLQSFKRVLATEKPDIIHFHEYSTGNGIVKKHVRLAKQTGARLVMTFHLANYTCRTGTLVYKSESLCDGKIEVGKCSSCYLHSRGFGNLENILLPMSRIAGFLHLDMAAWNNKVGTALATTQLLGRFQAEFVSLLNELDAFVSITSWYKKILSVNGVPQNKIEFIPQGLPLDMSSFKTESQQSSVVRLIFIGRISAFKGLHLLIDALQTLPQEKITLSIYGQPADADYERDLRVKSERLANISWKGKLAQADVIPVLQQHDLLCLCSTFSEMSPLVIQEAFTAGIPVLASNVYGNAEQVQHGRNGLLFAFNNVTSLREQLQYCLDDSGLMERLKKNVPPSRSFREVAADYHLLYQRLCSQ